MSSMANMALSRRSDYVAAGTSPKGLERIVKALASTPELVASPLAGAAAPQSAGATSTNAVSNAINVIAAYIPTEILTVYVAVLAALRHPSQASTPDVFYAFLAATPVVVWLIFAAKVKGAGKTLPCLPAQWPIWEMVAASISFIAWALTLSDNPFANSSWYSSSLSGIVVLIVSTLLGLLAPLFQHAISV
jgi:hypothetical protein